MNENQENTLIERAKNWIVRIYKPRTDAQQEAYLQGVEDTLMAVYGDGYHGAYPASKMYGILDEMFAAWQDGTLVNWKKEDYNK